MEHMKFGVTVTVLDKMMPTRRDLCENRVTDDRTFLKGVN
jgi:hypothetical protein